MTGTHVFDRLASDGGAAAERTADHEALERLAGQMVAASVASGNMLRELRERMFPAGDAAGGVAVAKTLRREFEQWVADAEQVIERADRLESVGRAVPRTRELADLIGATRAMLSISLDDHLRSLRDTTHPATVEELRRELQLKPRS
jgi:hypothetical protein